MILAVLQARTSSSRFPGKVLKPLHGKPMILRQLERIERSTTIDRFLVATSDETSDDELARICADAGMEVFRGSLNNVLDRYYQAALLHQPQHVVRLTGDCPLIDPEIIDAIVTYHLDGAFDYTSNTIEPTFPDGLDVEVCTFKALEEAWLKAALPSEKEHVMPFIHKRPNRYKLGSYISETDLSDLRWTVDERQDFELISILYDALYPNSPRFTTKEILRYIEQRPELRLLNSNFTRNEGYYKSIAEDQS